MKKLLAVVILAAVAGGLTYFLTHKNAKAQSLGAPISLSAIMKVADAAKLANSKPVELAIQGEITEKCPTAGCWFYLKDKTGSIRVDTQFAGFNVLDVPTGSKVTVQGKVTIPEDGEPEIAASGMRVER